MTGFIAMQRDALDHPLLRDAERFRAWFWLVANAAWKPTKFDIRGSMVPIDRGQLCVSIRQLADAWGWSKSAVDRFLTRLETETMLEREAGHGRLVITIRNYAKYQDGEKAQRDTSGTPTGTPAGHQRDIKEQGNKETSDPNGSQSRKRVDAKFSIPADWVLPPRSELPPKARALADEWSDASYETQGEAFFGFWRSDGRKYKDWTLVWANRIVAIHGQVMRDQKFGNAPPDAGRGKPTAPAHAATSLETSAATYRRIGRDYEADQMEAQARRLRGGTPTRPVGEILKAANAP